LLFLQPSLVGAQRPSRPSDSGNRLYNPFHVEFKRAWDLTLPDPVKLIDIGPITDSHRSNLILLISGRAKSDTQRQLRVLHWNEPRFLVDVEVASQSIGIDSLLIGHFHPGKPTVVIDPAKAATKPAKHKPSSEPRGLQILTNAGVYVWADNNLARLAAVPPDVKQAIELDGRTDLMLVGAGEGTTPYEFNENDLRPVPPGVLNGGGYSHFGIGTQDFPGSDTLNLEPGIRYIQSIWSGKTKWIIGLVRGTAAATPEEPNATTGDRLVVYAPKFGSRDKSFWATRSDDLEETWRSEPLSGRVLDVRVGDPKNDGKVGILVLTSENNEKDRRLTFFAVFGAG
jgi:hypothetical protein